MLARVRCRAVFFFGSRSVHERRERRGHDDQVPVGMDDARQRRRVLLCAGQRLLQEEGLKRRDRQGQRLRATVTHIMSGAYDAGLRRHQCADPERLDQARRCAGHGLYMVWNQPPFAIVTKKTSGINTIKDFRRPYVARRPHRARRPTRLLPVFVQKNKLEGEQDQAFQHGAEPAGADADQGDIDRRPGVQYHQLFQSRLKQPGSRQGLQVVLVRRLRHGLFPTA